MVEDRTHVVEREHRAALCADIVNNLQTAVVVWQVVDPDDPSTIRRVFANLASDANAHAKPGELDGTTLGESFPVLLETEIPAKMIEVARTGKAIDLGEVHYGDERVARGVYRAMAYPLPDRCVCIVYDDVTARVQAEDAVRHAEERVRRIIDSANEAFVSMDSEGAITEWNREAEATFGWTRAEAIGRRAADTIVPPRLREAHLEGVGRFLATGDEQMLNRRVELAAINRDGREFPIEMTVTATRDGHSYSFHALLHDISERKGAEAALRRTRDELEERVKERTAELAKANAELRKLDEMKNEFVATASHELRTPVAVIKGGLENVLDGFYGKLDGPQRRMLEVVKQNSAHMSSLVNDLLDLSRMDSRTLELQRRPIDLSDPVRAAAEGIASLADRRQIELLTELPELPVQATVDEARVAQIVTNLVENAVDFAASEVRVALSSDTDDAQIVVEDDGPGIPADHIEAIFERFARFPGPSTRTGAGLGLSIVRGIVAAHGGRIVAENRTDGEETGARFVVTLPRQPPAESTVASPQVGSGEARVHSEGGK